MNLDTIKTFVRPFLTSIHRKNWCFTYFTAHDSSHSEAIWNLARTIASDKLSNFELELLEAACICHDVGMAKFTSDDNIRVDPDPEYCDFVRKNHHLRSKEFVLTYKEMMGLTDRQAEIIGDICCSHSSKVNLSLLNDFKLCYNGHHLEKVRTRLLGSILRISDALDASSDRIPLDSYLKEASYGSKIEYLKHMLVRKVVINTGKISIELSNDPLQKVDSVKDKLMEEFASVKDELNHARLVSSFEFDYSEITVDESKLQFVPEDIIRINKLYVKPSCFDEIFEKLINHNIVIVSGDANVGKTSTANYIAGLRFFENENPILIVRPEMRIERTLSNHTIIIDDAYGESRYGDRFSISYNDIFQLKENNKVIITSREQVLIDALRQDRIGEADYHNWIVNLGQEGSYNDDALKEVLKNHLRYYFKKGIIKKEDMEIASKHQNEIIRSLRFPHNIDIFVKEKLKTILNEGKKLKDAIEESKHIKRVAKNWFLSLDDTRKFFVFSVWLFSTQLKLFEIIYPNVIETLKKHKPHLELEDISELIQITSSFIVYDEEYDLNKDKIHFRHQNYREGVNEAIEQSLGDYILSLGTLFGDLFKIHNIFLRSSLNNGLMQIASLNPNWTLTLIKELVNDDSDIVKGEISLVLGKFRYLMPDESIALLKELADESSWRVKEHVAEALVLGMIDDIVQLEPHGISESYEILKKLAYDPHCNVKAKVAEVLGTFGFIRPDESIALLKELAEVDNCIIRMNVAESIGRFGYLRSDQSMAILENLSNDKNCWKVREAIINALFTSVEASLKSENSNEIDVGFLRHQTTFNLLNKFISDDHPRVKETLGYYLVMGLVDDVSDQCFGSDDYINLLKKIVDESDPCVKIAVADGITEFGYLISSEFEGLLEILSRDNCSTVRKVCECREISRMLHNNQDYIINPIEMDDNDDNMGKTSSDFDSTLDLPQCNTCEINLYEADSLYQCDCGAIICDKCLIPVGDDIKCPNCGHIGDFLSFGVFLS